MNNPVQFLTSMEVCKMLRISRVTLWRLERAGVLKAYRLPTTRRKLYSFDEVVKVVRGGV